MPVRFFIPIRNALFLLLATLTSCLPATPANSTQTAPGATVTATLAPPATVTTTAASVANPTPLPVETMVRETDGMTMAHIPAGTFKMGSDSGDGDEAPVHEVYLDSFWMDTTEVTNGMYSRCVQAGSCKLPRETSSYTRANYYDDPRFADYPVVYVDWSMANAYCQWAGAHLPTEAQWERSASGDDDRIFPWGNDWDVVKRKRLNFADGNNPETTSDVTLNDGFRENAPVGSFEGGRSPYGVYDMAGNVWEWVGDWYDPAYYSSSPTDNPQGPDGPTTEISMRALRGGSWVAANEMVFHTSNRNGLDPSHSSESLGFRCAR